MPLTVYSHSDTIVFFVLTSIFGIIFLVCHYAMIKAINRHPTPGQPVDVIFNYPGKAREVRSQYKALYPRGRLAMFERLSLLVGAIFFVCFASAVGIIRWDVIWFNIRGAL